jgi:hypothetical protein
VHHFVAAQLAQTRRDQPPVAIGNVLFCTEQGEWRFDLE